MTSHRQLRAAAEHGPVERRDDGLRARGDELEDAIAAETDGLALLGRAQRRELVDVGPREARRR
jgi:hypothetical protein